MLHVLATSEQSPGQGRADGPAADIGLRANDPDAADSERNGHIGNTGSACAVVQARRMQRGSRRARRTSTWPGRNGHEASD